MVSNVFVADQAAQTYNIYLIIYVCVGNYGSRFQRTYIKSTKNPGFHTFFKIQGILLEIYQIQDVKSLVFQNFLIRNSQYFDRNPRFSIEILGISIEVLGFSFEILGISKICDNRIPQVSGLTPKTAKCEIAGYKMRNSRYLWNRIVTYFRNTQYFKKGSKSRVFSGFYVSSGIGFRSYLRIRRLLIKYYVSPASSTTKTCDAIY